MTSNDRAFLVTLARAVATTPPVSMEETARLEEQLHALDNKLPGYEEFEEAVISYHPGGGDQLLNEQGLQRAARELLHELGDHGLCFHDVPLADRP